MRIEKKKKNIIMMKKRHILHWAMGVVLTPLLGSCAFDELHEIAGGGNGMLSFGVEVNAGAPEVKPMGGATRAADSGNGSATGSAVMSPDVEGFFPTSSVELSSVDGNAIYANCDERRGINMHNNVDYKATRGSIISEEANNFYSSFALYGYVYGSGQTWSSVGNSTDVDGKINGIEMKKNVSGNDYIANTNPKVYWPGASNKATFFAVAPKDCPGASITANSGGPQITYTVPQEVSKQEDFLLAVAKDVICDGKNAPSLAFNHALAAIKFEEGTLTGYSSISKVEISGVKNKGTLSSFETPSWTGQEINESGANTYTISDLSNVMFLMPQTTPDGAKLKVTFKKDTEEKAFEADLKGTSWQAGHQYTYKLSVNKVTGTFHFEVSPSTASIAITGGTVEFTVKSYFQYQDNTTTAIPWTGSYNTNGTTTTRSGQGGTTGDKVSISIDSNSSTSSSLTTNPSKGTAEKPWNLSNSQGEANVENTANCYVVNSKGTYSIPLVYGCAIKNGQPNDKSYNSTTFVNHAGTQINSPYIYEMVDNIDGAKLIWQDVQNMVTSIGLSSDNKSLIFEIGNNIAQGNAVVAATANGTVVWSWHIWVTDRDVSVNAAIPTKAFDPSYTYNFMPVPLGWCDGTTSTVAPRNFTLSLIQGQSGKNLSATIAQAGSTATSGNFTYYQWGRKDPFVGSTGTGNTCKTWYDGSGTQQSSLKINNSTRTKKYAITNPEYFIYGASQWDTGTTTYDDWNANLSSNTAPSPQFNYTVVEKTVYDPSPVGYKLPPTNAFTGFGKALGTGAQTANGSGFSNGGWNFYTGGQSTGPTDFWIAGGYRNWNNSGSLHDVGSYGNYWSAGPYSTSNGCYLRFYSSSVYPQNYYHRADGFSVRPVSE